MSERQDALGGPEIAKSVAAVGCNIIGVGMQHWAHCVGLISWGLCATASLDPHRGIYRRSDYRSDEVVTTQKSECSRLCGEFNTLVMYVPQSRLVTSTLVIHEFGSQAGPAVTRNVPSGPDHLVSLTRSREDEAT